MHLLFVVDPWPNLHVGKDSSLAMMRCALAQHINVSLTTADRLWRAPSGAVCAEVFALKSAGSIAGTAIDVATTGETIALTSFHAVVMRKDPPFDLDYVANLWLLRAAQQQGACVVNNPEAVLLHNEKASILEFSEHTPPTLVTQDPAQVRDLLQQHGDIIVKPLNGMGGSGIFRLRLGDKNTNAILETFAGTPIMAQTYLPEIAEGDKRVLVINGAVLPYTLARIPSADEHRGNLAQGGSGVAMPITAAEQAVGEKLAPILLERGLIIVGLDMIGGKLTEINVTSPTCMVEIEAQTGYAVADHALQAIIAQRAYSISK